MRCDVATHLAPPCCALLLGRHHPGRHRPGGHGAPHIGTVKHFRTTHKVLHLTSCVGAGAATSSPSQHVPPLLRASCERVLALWATPHYRQLSRRCCAAVAHSKRCARGCQAGKRQMAWWRRTVNQRQSSEATATRRRGSATTAQGSQSRSPHGFRLCAELVARCIARLPQLLQLPRRALPPWSLKRTRLAQRVCATVQRAGTSARGGRTERTTSCTGRAVPSCWCMGLAQIRTTFATTSRSCPRRTPFTASACSVTAGRRSLSWTVRS